MKKLLLVAALVLGTIACEKYDDTELKDSIVNLQGQVDGNKAQLAQLAAANATLQAAITAGDNDAALALSDAIAALNLAISQGDADAQTIAADALAAAVDSVSGQIELLAMRVEHLEGAVKSLEDAVVSYEDLTNVPDINGMITQAVGELAAYIASNEGTWSADSDTIFDPSSILEVIAALDKYIKDSEVVWSTDNDTVFDATELATAITALNDYIALMKLLGLLILTLNQCLILLILSLQSLLLKCKLVY